MVVVGGAGTNPLKTTASSRRASTLAARRNNASTLAKSGSAICAVRSSTFTCSVASWIVSLSWIVSGAPEAMICARTKSVSAGSGPVSGRKVAATRARLASS